LASRGALKPAHNASQNNAGGPKAIAATRSHSNAATRMQSRIFGIVSVILSGAERSRKIPTNELIVMQRDSSTSLGMTGQMRGKFAQFFLTFNTQI
jgi:hypothetical protein